MATIINMLADVERGPTQGQMADAPRLDGWWIVVIGGFLHAKGDVSGHPDIKDPFVTTSPIIGFDAPEGWVRTRSRFYSLGMQLSLDGFKLVDAVPLNEAQEILARMRSDLLAELSSGKLAEA